MNTIINFCPTGMIPKKSQTPHVPISPQEIIEEVHQAYEIGITIAHLHARDSEGKPQWSPELYSQIVEGVRYHCPELLICLSTSGRDFPEFEKRSAVIELKPDMCSLTLSSLNFVQQASINQPEMIIRLAEKMKAYGVRPEFECFDLGMINFGKYLIKKLDLSSPQYWNLLFGNIAGWQTDLLSIGVATSQIPSTDFTVLAGLGSSQSTIAGIAAASGFGIRIGIEDNIWWDHKRTQLAQNKELLERVHHLLTIHERTYMSSCELGKLGFYNASRSH